MTFDISFNNVSIPKRKPFWEESYFGLTFERDPRPRCSLILGDGFTQGFLASQGIKDRILLSVDNHFPPPENTMYIPVRDDVFEKSKLWDAKKWPNLYSFWESIGKLNGRDFYLALHKAEINPHKNIGKLSYDTGSIGFELRCYLWHLFRSKNYEMKELLQNNGVNLQSWEWFKPFKILLSEFALGVATFNYDLIVEDILHQVFFKNVIFHDLSSEDEFSRRPADSIALYKIHGSISYYINTGMSSIIQLGPKSNPWLVNAKYHFNTIGNANLDVDPRVESFPEFPDIVPPGHLGDDKLNPQSVVLPLSKCHIKASCLVIICGLSAEEPDTDEVRGLVEEINLDAVVIHVGLESDRNNKLAKMLMDRGIESTFFLPDQLKKIGDIVGEKIPLHRAWS
ncbi:MAG: hypothetical protein EOO52_16495 [Gammaproteobacteria bacterium]|nr:MAG: hypothetical protein EOO52_16495 [Gammaproteobacteria bacterium]